MIRRPPRSSLYFCSLCFLFFFNDTATTEIYTLSLHDALPIYLPGEGAQLAVIGIAHVGKALLPLLERALQRVPEHEVDVVSDEHQRGRPESEADPPRGVGDDQGADAEPGEHARRQRRQLGRVALIEMKAAALDQYRHALERAGDELSLVARSGGLGKARNCGLRNADCGLNRIGHRSQTRPQDDRDARLERAEPARDGVSGRTDGTAPGSLLPVVHNSIPASVPDRKLASVPAIMARKPRRARSCLRSGTSAPIPPICMPTELMLAKPHSANVAIVKETGSSAGFMGPSWAYAMNSFSTMRVPSRLPMVPLSCHGTPMTQAIGLKTQPSTVWMFSGNHAAYPWTQPNTPLPRATSAMKETSMAITLSMRCSPSVVPRAAASTTFTSVRGMSTRTPPSVCGVSVSGSRIFAIMMVPGAVMITAVKRWRASIPNAM